LEIITVWSWIILKAMKHITKHFISYANSYMFRH